ncbi:MAG: CRISPR-associated endoribonuclease Cas6 [Eubacteriaceae bacterium]
MRLELNFELDQPIFPKDSRKVIISFIKKALTESRDGKNFTEFFNGTIQKPYCFSIKFFKPEFRKDQVYLQGKQMKVIFSIADREEILGFKMYFALIEQKNKKFPLENDNHMVLTQIVEKREIEIIGSKAVFRTTIGGGVCVRVHDRKTNKDRYVVPGDPGFEEALHKTLESQLIMAGFSEDIAKIVRCKPLETKKVLVWHYHCYIDTIIGTFEIKAPPEVLNYLYQGGLASRKSSGFGSLDLISQGVD